MSRLGGERLSTEIQRGSTLIFVDLLPAGTQHTQSSPCCSKLHLRTGPAFSLLTTLHRGSSDPDGGWRLRANEMWLSEAI